MKKFALLFLLVAVAVLSGCNGTNVNNNPAKKPQDAWLGTWTGQLSWDGGDPSTGDTVTLSVSLPQATVSGYTYTVRGVSTPSFTSVSPWTANLAVGNVGQALVTGNFLCTSLCPFPAANGSFQGALNGKTIVFQSVVGGQQYLIPNGTLTKQ